MKNPTITITCLAYRTLQTTPAAIESAWNLDYDGDIEILVREQGGDEEELETLQALANDLRAKNRTIHIEKAENLGFAGGHNALFRKAKGEFILALNADAVLQPDYLEYALPAFEDPAVGAVQGKLLRWDMEKMNSPILKNGNSVIDTTGLEFLPNRRIINRGQGTEDTGQFDEPGEVWGADGALPLYRKAALDAVAYPRPDGSREYFDEDFFAYKEDVDLAWRLQWLGWKTKYVPKAIGWHGRTGGENAALSYREIIQERRKIAPLLKYYSFSNQRLLLLKNEDFGRYLHDLPRWFAKEIGAWGYSLLLERKTLPAIWRTLKLTPKILQKRKYTMSHKADGADPYRFFS